MPWDGRSHYLASLYRTDLAERIDRLVAGGARSMRALIDASDAQQIVLPESRFLANVNTEADLRGNSLNSPADCQARACARAPLPPNSRLVSMR